MIAEATYDPLISNELERYSTNNPGIEGAENLKKILCFLADHPSFVPEFSKQVEGYTKDHEVVTEKFLNEWLKACSTEYPKKEPDGFNWEPTNTKEINDELQESSLKFEKNAESIWKWGNKEPYKVKDLARIREKTTGEKLSNIEDNIRNAIKTQKVIAYKLNPGAKSTWYMPAWQFDAETGQALVDVYPLMGLFNNDSFMLQQFLVTCRLAETEESMIDILLKGKEAEILRYARIYIGME